MKATLTLICLFLGNEACFAASPGDLAFERFSYELSKATSLTDRKFALSLYAEDLFRSDTAPISWGQCISSFEGFQSSLAGCEPDGAIVARIGGGTGGVE